MEYLAYTKIEKYMITAECTAPLHIGSTVGDKSEVLVHPVTNRPFIQASSLAGVLREVSTKVNGSSVTDRLFGRSNNGEDDKDKGSMVRIGDGVFHNECVKMEYRPRVAINPHTGSVATAVISGNQQVSGQKFDMEMIAQGETFSFILYLYHEEDGTEDKIEQLLASLKSNQIQIGGQKSNGCGFVHLISLKKCSFDLKSDVGRKLWMKEEDLEENHYQDITDQLDAKGYSTQAYRVTVNARSEGSLIIKGIAVTEYGEGAPDAENMKNASDHYIIPGSSLKGALRNRMTYIAEKIHKKDIIEDIFGKTGNVGAKAGNIYVKDTIIGKDDVHTLHSQRIHIDKFTGGVMQTGLFSEKTVAGDMNLEILIADKNHPEVTLGLLLFALRDMAAGLYNLGSGYNVGHGFLQVNHIQIESLKSGDMAELNFQYSNQGIHLKKKDTQGLIQSGLDALKK